MVEKNNLIMGFLVLLFISTGIYITLNTGSELGLRMRNDIDKTVFYENSTGRWLITGIEQNRLFEGTKIIDRVRKGIKNETNIIGTNVIYTRETPYINSCFIKDTYSYDYTLIALETFPIEHKIEVINCFDYFYRYSIDKLYGSYVKRKIINETSLSFQKNMKVEFEPNYRWAWIGWPYGDDSFSVQYYIESDYEVFYIRLFDPLVSSDNVEVNLTMLPDQAINISDVTASMSTNASNLIYNYDWYNTTSDDGLVMWHDYTNANALDLTGVNNGAVSGVPSETAWWKFDDDMMDNANSHDGTEIGSYESITYKIFKLYKGITFNANATGSGKYMAIDKITMNAGDSFCWWGQHHAWTSGFTGGSTYRNGKGTIFGLSTDNHDSCLNFEGDGDRTSLQAEDGTTWTSTAFSANLEEIYHGCIILKSAGLEWWKNGVLVETETTPYLTNTTSIDRIGWGYSGVTTNATFDDFRYYNNTELSLAEIQKIYREGRGSDMALELYSHYDDEPAVAQFDGVDDYMNIDGSEVYGNNNDFTFYMLVNCDAQDDKRFYAEGNSSDSTNPVFLLGTETGGSHDGVRIFVRNQSNSVLISDECTNIVMCDGTSKSVVYVDNSTYYSVYIDGVKDTSCEGIYTKNIGNFDRTTIGAIGRTVYSSFFKGSISEVRIYNRSLSDSEILALNNSDKYMTRFIDDGTLIFNWVADNNKTYDYSGGNDLTRGNDPLYEQDSNGLSFQTFIHGASIPYLEGDSLNVSNISSKSVVSIFKTNENPDGADIVFKMGYYLRLTYRFSPMQFRVRTADIATQIVIGDGNRDWHCVVGTFNYSGGFQTLNLYVDLDISSTNTQDGFGVGSIDKLIIGQSTNSSISETQFYNRVLSEEEARQICRWHLMQYNDTSSQLNSSETNIGDYWTVNTVPYNATETFSSVLSTAKIIYDTLTTFVITLSTGISNIYFFTSGYNTSTGLWTDYNISALDQTSSKGLFSWTKNTVLTLDIQSKLNISNSSFDIKCSDDNDINNAVTLSTTHQDVVTSCDDGGQIWCWMSYINVSNTLPFRIQFQDSVSS